MMASSTNQTAVISQLFLKRANPNIQDMVQSFLRSCSCSSYSSSCRLPLPLCLAALSLPTRPAPSSRTPSPEWCSQTSRSLPLPSPLPSTVWHDGADGGKQQGVHGSGATTSR